MPREILLIPGFTSPAWMLWPLKRFLRRRFPSVATWDSRHIFEDPEHAAERLAGRLADGPVKAVVAHSFGDCIVRAALQQTDLRQVQQLISICPVAAPVPIARLLRHCRLAVTAELRAMAEGLASANLQLPDALDHRVYWARHEWLISRPSNYPGVHARVTTLQGTHNSIVFLPSWWRKVAADLEDGE